MGTLLLCFFICLGSTMLGAISGIGGGVIIKPMLDLSVSALGMEKISLLSSFAVLCMALFSVGKNLLAKNRQAIRLSVALPLGVGSTLGGVLGKALFKAVAAGLHADALVKLLQNGLLLVLMAVVLIGALRGKERLPKERPLWAGLPLGFALGLFAAFLGIGGGPLNMMALTVFYGLAYKEAALYSLFIIILSQAAGVLTAAFGGGAFPALPLLLTACAAGILGGVIGRRLVKTMSNQAVKTLYNLALVFIMALCVFNGLNVLLAKA